MKEQNEIEKLRDITADIMENSARFNAETRANARGAYEALSWALGEQDPPFTDEDLQ